MGALGRHMVTGLLGASLVLNLVLGGLLLWQPKPPPPPARGFDRMVARIEAALPEADRPRFHAVLMAGRAHYAAPLNAMRSARAEVDAVMRNEPYDPAALHSALTAWSAQQAAFNAAFSEVLAEALGAVSPEGRAKVASARRPGG